MKIYLKDKMRITLPEVPDDATGYAVSGQVFTREDIAQINEEIKGFDRTMARLTASKMLRKVRELEDKV